MKAINFIFALSLMVFITACADDSGSDNYGKFNRAELRYYAYAPPLIPHKVINRECMDCHKTGLVVDGYKAPVTPHPQLVNCQQCHIYANENVKPFQKNSFVGLQEPDKLALPQPAGPPLMPHRVFMRENCLVCHYDPSRDEIIQTTHPERLNCTQCHVEQNSQVALFRENTSMQDAF